MSILLFLCGGLGFASEAGGREFKSGLKYGVFLLVNSTQGLRSVVADADTVCDKPCQVQDINQLARVSAVHS